MREPIKSSIYIGIFEWDSHSLPEWEKLACQVGHRSKNEFSSESRYLEHLAGRGAIAILAKQLNWKITLSTGAFGEPRVKGRENTFASVSHTKGIAVGAIATYPIGVDIEDTKRVISDKVIRKVCHSDELKSFSPIYLWSAKESVSKALGIGIKFGLRAFQIAPIDKKNAQVIFHSQYPTPFALRDAQVSFILHKNWVVSICSEKNAFDTPIKRINLS